MYGFTRIWFLKVEKMATNIVGVPFFAESNQAEIIVLISESLMRTLRARAAVRADARGGDGAVRPGAWGTGANCNWGGHA